jgi:hypothetical protein
VDFRPLPHPEEPAQRASRRMAGRMKTWFETRGCAALLTMRDRGRAGSSPVVTREGRGRRPRSYCITPKLLRHCRAAAKPRDPAIHAECPHLHGTCSSSSLEGPLTFAGFALNMLHQCSAQYYS